MSKAAQAIFYGEAVSRKGAKAQSSESAERKAMRALLRAVASRFYDTFGGYQGLLALGMALLPAAIPEIFEVYNAVPGLWIHGAPRQGKTSTDAQLRSRFAHVLVSEERRLANHFDWMQQHSSDFFVFGRYLMEHRPEFAALVLAKLKGWLEDSAMAAIEDERARMVHGCAYAAIAALTQLLGMDDPKMLRDFQAFLIRHAEAAAEEVDESVMVNQLWRDLLDAMKSGALGTPAEMRKFMKVVVNPRPRRKLSEAQTRAGLEDSTKRWEHYLLYIQLGPLLAALREWKRHGGQTLLADRQDLQAQMRTQPYWVEPPAALRKEGRASHRVRFSGKTLKYCVCLDLDYLAYVEVSDEQFEASQMKDPVKGEFFPRSERVDPRRGDLFALVDLLLTYFSCSLLRVLSFGPGFGLSNTFSVWCAKGAPRWEGNESSSVKSPS